MPNTTVAEFANTVDQDETTHNEPSHLYLQYSPFSQEKAVKHWMGIKKTR